MSNLSLKSSQSSLTGGCDSEGGCDSGECHSNTTIILKLLFFFFLNQAFGYFTSSTL